MASSVMYASYLASNNENPNHLNHIQEFRELATLIAKEQIESYLPQIESMITQTVNRAINDAFSKTSKAIDIDVKRIVDITCTDLNAQFHSEEIRRFFADTLKTTLENELKKMDVKLIVK